MRPRATIIQFTRNQARALSDSIRTFSTIAPEYQVICPETVSYDKFVIQHENEVSAGLNFNWSVLAEGAEIVLKSMCPDVVSAICAFLNWEADILLIKSMFIEDQLPPTPRRITRSVHSAKTPAVPFVADYILHGIGRLLGRVGGFVQSNINFVDESGTIIPLYAHTDRGAEFTLLSCLRSGNVVQRTRFVTIDYFLPLGGAESPAEANLFAPLIQQHHGHWCLSSQAIRQQLNWDEVRAFLAEHNIKVYQRFVAAEERFNAVIDGLKADDDVVGVRLESGDVIVFNNRRLVHGRDLAFVQHEPTQINKGENRDSRWLRALFL